MLAEGFGKNVQEGGFPIDSLGRVQLQPSRTSEAPLPTEGVELTHTRGRSLPAQPHAPVVNG